MFTPAAKALHETASRETALRAQKRLEEKK